MNEVKLTRYYNNSDERVMLLFSNLEHKDGCSYLGECLMKKLVSTYTSYDRKFANGFEFRGKRVTMIYFGDDDIETYLWIPHDVVKEKIPILLKWINKINYMNEIHDKRNVKYLKKIFGEPGNLSSECDDIRNRLRVAV